MDLRNLATYVVVTALIAAHCTTVGCRTAGAADLAAVISAHPKLAKFAAALKETGLLEKLKHRGPFTVLAPYDDAFKRIGEDGMKALRKSPEDYRKVVAFHIIAGKHPVAEWVKQGGGRIPTLAEEKLALKVDRKAVVIWDGVSTANVIHPDLAADNGILHVIDAVELPPAPRM